MPNAAGMAQLNVRIDPDIKAVAERNMEQAGYSATLVIRAVYDNIAKGTKGISRVVHALVDPAIEFFANQEAKQGISYADNPVSRRVDDAWNSLYLQIGLDPNNLPPLREYTDEELQAMYWDERDRERGLGIYAE